IDGQDLVLQKLSDSFLCLLIPAHEWEGGVGRGKEVVVKKSLLVAELAGAIAGQVAIAAGLRLGRVVEGAHGAARDARVVPSGVMVLPAHPAVAIQGRSQLDFVAGRGENRGFEKRLSRRLPLMGGLHTGPHGGGSGR